MLMVDFKWEISLGSAANLAALVAFILGIIRAYGNVRADFASMKVKVDALWTRFIGGGGDGRSRASSQLSRSVQQQDEGPAEGTAGPGSLHSDGDHPGAPALLGVDAEDALTYAHWCPACGWSIEHNDPLLRFCPHDGQPMTARLEAIH